MRVENVYMHVFTYCEYITQFTITESTNCGHGGNYSSELQIAAAALRDYDGMRVKIVYMHVFFLL